MTITPENLTIKQRKWLFLYIELGNATEAAMKAYDCKDRDSARAIGGENLAKLNYSDLLEEAGITDYQLAKKLKEGLYATKQLSARGGREANANTDDFIEVEDFLTRHKYLETALKIKGRLVNKHEANITANGKGIAPLVILDTHQ